MVKVKPVVRQSLVETVVERIRAVIVDGHFGPGQRLPTEADWVEQLQVSRTVIREAVGRLEAMGLVTVRGSRGMFVGDTGSLLNCVRLVRSAMIISPRELIRFTEFRRAIECDSARQAAGRAGPKDLAELDDLCEQIRRPDLGDSEAFALDFQFHRKILELTGNELTCNVMDVVQEFVLASIRECGYRRRDPEVTYAGHRAVVDAIRQKNPDAAEKAMREHLNAVIEGLQAHGLPEDN